MQIFSTFQCIRNLKRPILFDHLEYVRVSCGQKLLTLSLDHGNNSMKPGSSNQIFLGQNGQKFI